MIRGTPFVYQGHTYRVDYSAKGFEAYQIQPRNSRCKAHESRLTAWGQHWTKVVREHRQRTAAPRVCANCAHAESYIPADEDGAGRVFCRYPVERLPLAARAQGLESVAARAQGLESVAADAQGCPTWEAVKPA